jgi:phosphatidylglycerophosphatase A
LGHLGVTLLCLRLVMGTVVLSASVVCVLLAPAAMARTGRKDPGEVVMDEVAGQAVTFCALPGAFWSGAAPNQIWITALIGFLLFRFFDITKIWPVCRLEKLPAGWGILADDLWAGLYAMVVLTLGIHWIAL